MLKQLIAFASVGALATLVHIGVAEGVHVLARVPGYLATLVGFGVAFLVSYMGHFHLTFRGEAEHKEAVWRFFAVALSGFFLSLAALLLLEQGLGLRPVIALPLSVLVIPIYTFMLSKLWVFRRR